MSFKLPRVTKLNVVLASLFVVGYTSALYFIFTQTGIVWGTVGLVVLTVLSWARSSPKYDGTIDIEHVDGVKRFSLNLYSDPETLDARKSITFKINPT